MDINCNLSYRVYGYDSGAAIGDWQLARDTSDGYSNSLNLTVGQRVQGPPSSSRCYVYRSFIRFDTSVIDFEIGKVYLKMTPSYLDAAQNFNIEIIKQDWALFAGTPYVYRESAYDACFSGTLDQIFANSSDLVVGTEHDSTDLDVTWINKTGHTYYSLRSSRGNIYPTVNVFEYVEFYNASSIYKPVLVVEPLATKNLMFWFT